MRILSGLLLFFLFSVVPALAQDTLLLINGRQLIVKSVDLKDFTIAYRTLDKNRLRTIDPYRVFSISYADGTERVIYQSDSLDPVDFTPDQMRMFIRGEQDADRYYRNTPNKAAAFLIGGGASYFTIYGLVIPPLYATVVGSFSPRIEKYRTDINLLNVSEYREGYERKARDRKIRNALIGGMAGFVTGFVVLNLVAN
jgi:hypothetical protein